jgi:hypothetical protein
MHTLFLHTFLPLARVTVTLNVDPSGGTARLYGAGCNTNTGTSASCTIESDEEGVVVWSDLHISVAATGYVFAYTEATLSLEAMSEPFEITEGLPFALALANVGNGNSGVLPAGITATIQDAGGTACATSTNAITVSLSTSTPAMTLAGTLDQNPTSGVSTFPDLTLSCAGTSIQLQFSTPGMGSAITVLSVAFSSIGSGIASSLSVPGVVTSSAAGGALASFTVSIQDSCTTDVGSGTNDVLLAITTDTSPGTNVVLGGTTTATATAGVATFADITMDAAANGYIMTATTAGLTSGVSAAFNVDEGIPTKMGFASLVDTATHAVATFTVTIQDKGGTATPSASHDITVAITTDPSGASATLGGTLTVSSSSGTSTFTGLTIDVKGTGYVLSASATSLTTSASSAFNIGNGIPTQVVVGAITASSTHSITTFTATVADKGGLTVTTSTNAITVALTTDTSPGTNAVLGGTMTVSASSGVASFSTLTLDVKADGYVVTASTGSLTNGASAAFNIGNGIPTQITCATIADSLSSSVTTFTVSIEDKAGNAVTTSTDSISISITTDGSPSSNAVLGGTTAVSASSGVASFSTLTIDVKGNGYVLTASAGSLTNGVSAAFNIASGIATKLSVSGPGTATDSNIPDVTVSVQDKASQTVTADSTTSVVAAVQSNPGSATLSGTATLTVSSGVAVFDALALSVQADGYTLRFTSGGLSSVDTSSFNMPEGLPHQLAIIQQPSNSGSASVTQIRVELRDSQGNPTPSSTAAVTATLNDPTAFSVGLDGTNPVNTISAVATFTTLTVDTLASGYSIVSQEQA